MKKRRLMGDCLENKSYAATIAFSAAGAYISYILLCLFHVIEPNTFKGVLLALPFTYVFGSFACMIYLGGFPRTALFFPTMIYVNAIKIGVMAVVKFWYLFFLSIPFFILMFVGGLVALLIGLAVSIASSPFCYPFGIYGQIKAHNKKGTRRMHL